MTPIVDDKKLYNAYIEDLSNLDHFDENEYSFICKLNNRKILRFSLQEHVIAKNYRAIVTLLIAEGVDFTALCSSSNNILTPQNYESYKIVFSNGYRLNSLIPLNIEKIFLEKLDTLFNAYDFLWSLYKQFLQPNLDEIRSEQKKISDSIIKAKNLHKSEDITSLHMLYCVLDKIKVLKEKNIDVKKIEDIFIEPSDIMAGISDLLSYFNLDHDLVDYIIVNQQNFLMLKTLSVLSYPFLKFNKFISETEEKYKIPKKVRFTEPEVEPKKPLWEQKIKYPSYNIQIEK